MAVLIRKLPCGKMSTCIHKWWSIKQSDHIHRKFTSKLIVSYLKYIQCLWSVVSYTHRLIKSPRPHGVNVVRYPDTFYVIWRWQPWYTNVLNYSQVSHKTVRQHRHIKTWILGICDIVNMIILWGENFGNWRIVNRSMVKSILWILPIVGVVMVIPNISNFGNWCIVKGIRPNRYNRCNR